MNELQFENSHRRMSTVWGHPYATKCGRVLRYRLEVEESIGRYLTPKEVIHHHYNWDGSVTLVLCPDAHYHKLLHRREEALRYCGNANWRKCTFCKQYDDPKNLSINISSQSIYHKLCNKNYHKNYGREYYLANK